MAQVYGRSEKHITADISNGNAAVGISMYDSSEYLYTTVEYLDFVARHEILIIQDLGEAALLSRVNQPMLFAPPPLTLSKLYKELLVMSQARGKVSFAYARRRIFSSIIVKW